MRISLARLEGAGAALALLLVGVQTVGASAQDAGRPIYLTHVQLVDGVSAEPTSGVTLVLSGRLIASVHTGPVTPPAGAAIYDVAGRYVTPGLIDAHSHLNTLSAARRALLSGVTTVRTAGVGGYQDVVLRELVEAGRLAGPDIIATGVYVTPDLGESVLADVSLAPLMDGVRSLEDLRALVRINHEHGVDWIKARTTERSGLVDNDPRRQVYTEEQIRAVVDEATKLGMPVMIHAHGESGVRAAVLGGARSVEHATYASDETLRLMKARGTYLVPTLGSITSFGQAGDYADPELLLRGLHMAPRRIEMVQRAYAMGIPIVTGADTGYGPESAARISRGMDRLVQLGMEPFDVIKAATSRAAELLQIEDRTGSVEPGLEADLLIVERNPFEHIRTLQDPLAIISNGRVVLNRVLEEASKGSP